MAVGWRSSRLILSVSVRVRPSDRSLPVLLCVASVSFRRAEGLAWLLVLISWSCTDEAEDEAEE